MATEAQKKIRDAQKPDFPRLEEKQDIILYRISIRQDEQGRQSHLVPIAKINEDPIYKELIDKEYLTYEQFGEGDKAIANLIITLKGQRYLYTWLDEVSELEWNSRQQF